MAKGHRVYAVPFSFLRQTSGGGWAISPVRIDLNADVGESTTPLEELVELALTSIVSSVNIACGAHAGDRGAMRRLVAVACARGLAVGAHPGYPDPEHRGRMPLMVPPEDVHGLVRDQIQELAAIAADRGLQLSHVKPHGALYNQAAIDRPLADAVATAIRDVDSAIRLIGPCGSRLLDAGLAAGLDVRAEAFVDRAYREDGTLVPRTESGALITSADEAVAQALGIVLDGVVPIAGGQARWRLRAETLCVHADTPGAVFLARRVRAALVARGVEIGAEPRQAARASDPS